MLKVIAVFGLALLSLATSYAIVTYWPENPAASSTAALPRLECASAGRPRGAAGH